MRVLLLSGLQDLVTNRRRPASHKAVVVEELLARARLAVQLDRHRIHDRGGRRLVATVGVILLLEADVAHVVVIRLPRDHRVGAAEELGQRAVSRVENLGDDVEPPVDARRDIAISVGLEESVRLGEVGLREVAVLLVSDVAEPERLGSQQLGALHVVRLLVRPVLQAAALADLERGEHEPPGLLVALRAPVKVGPELEVVQAALEVAGPGAHVEGLGEHVLAKHGRGEQELDHHVLPLHGHAQVVRPLGPGVLGSLLAVPLVTCDPLRLGLGNHLVAELEGFVGRLDLGHGLFWDGQCLVVLAQQRRVVLDHVHLTGRCWK